ncbi:hypothetical protein MAR_016716 [Mya arenaria]|uniref:Polysaccharide lyase 14 domain-containing protein n=1 Tax=Mya arenaria TaxID=6604 RepID=A0ABY7EDG6_MYAAR|nr:hypothetical protein MAR_016716 [Mya arenaria]
MGRVRDQPRHTHSIHTLDYVKRTRPTTTNPQHPHTRVGEVYATNHDIPTPSTHSRTGRVRDQPPHTHTIHTLENGKCTRPTTTYPHHPHTREREVYATNHDIPTPSTHSRTGSVRDQQRHTHTIHTLKNGKSTRPTTTYPHHPHTQEREEYATNHDIPTPSTHSSTESVRDQPRHTHTIHTLENGKSTRPTTTRPTTTYRIYQRYPRELTTLVVTRVYFPDSFSWNRGGKLPGLWGGTRDCSGGRIKDTCFSTRLMWRPLGDGEGYIKLWVDGHAEVHVTDIIMRDNTGFDIDGLFFSTFFGGGDSSWASPHDTYTYFRNFKITTDTMTPSNSQLVG